MAVKEFQLDGIGTVKAFKRRGAKTIRLSIAGDGTIKVTMPYLAPYAAGLAFVRAKADWLKQHASAAKNSLLHDGQPIGKAHRLYFRPTNTELITSRIAGSEIVVCYPQNMSVDDEAVQSKAQQAVIRALRKQAAALLPGRLRSLATDCDFRFGTVTVKQLIRRWGSCDQRGNITLNLYLMILPWDLIDYVLLHELTHTKHLNHSPAFWDHMKQVLPDVQNCRRRIKQHQPRLPDL